MIENKFGQSPLIECVENEKGFSKSKKIVEKYNGLCDLICNYITDNDSLGNNKTINQDKMFADIEHKYVKTHLLKVSTIIQKLQAVIFQSYPSRVLSKEEQKNILSKDKNGEASINQSALEKGLGKVKEGECIKFCVFKKSGLLSFDNGHSMLVKKNPDNKYIFFDPNEGSTKPLDLKELKLNSKFKEWNKSDYGFNEVALMNNTSFIGKVKSKIKEFNQSITQNVSKVVKPPIVSHGQNKKKTQVLGK